MKQIDGQLTLFPINTNTSNVVAQANAMITGRQDLNLNESKLVRIMIMQIKQNDNEFLPYNASVPEIAKMLGLKNSSSIYRDIDRITSGISSKFLYILTPNGSWAKYPWVSRCLYNSFTNMMEMKLNDDLKPFLLKLEEYYTQYTLDTCLMFKSVYAIRIYELLIESIPSKDIPFNGTDVYLSLDSIKDACSLRTYNSKGQVIKEKYTDLSNLRKRVIDIAVKDINDAITHHVTYTARKSGKNIIGFVFHIRRRKV